MTDLVFREGDIVSTVEAQLPSARLVKQAVKNLVVTDEKSYGLACDLVKLVKKEWNGLDTLRKTITGPIRDAERNANSRFKPLLDHYAECELHLKEEIGRWELAIRQQREAAMLAAAPAPPPPEPSRGVSTRIVRKWRVTNPDKVPRQFCSPDATKIQAHLDAGGLEAIPGVEFYDDAITTVRT